jgi:hypothetical protein
LAEGIFAKSGATLGDRLVNRKNGHVINEGPQLGKRACWIVSAQGALEYLHIRDDADVHGFVCKAGQELGRLRHPVQVVNYPVGVNQVGHASRRSTFAGLLASGMNVLHELMPIHSLERSSSSGKHPPYSGWVMPVNFRSRCLNEVSIAFLLNKKRLFASSQ